MMKSGKSQRNADARRFWITGAAGGLGRAFCAACASRGYELLLTDVCQEALTVLAAGLRNEYGVQVQALACDLALEADRDRFFGELARMGARLDGLINVAGLDTEGEFASKEVSYLRRMIQINWALRLRREGAPFTIINVCSLAAFQPMPYKALYAAEKRFLLQLSLGIREELMDSAVTVTALCPAGMPTNRDCVEAIKAQGLAGTVTTKNTGDVAEYTLRRALRGKAVAVPGAINRVIMALSSIVPGTASARLVKRQWARALMRRCGTLRPFLKET